MPSTVSSPKVTSRTHKICSPSPEPSLAKPHSTAATCWAEPPPKATSFVRFPSPHQSKSNSSPQIILTSAPDNNYAAFRTSPEDDVAIYARTQSFFTRSTQYAKEQGQYRAFEYSNYALPSQNPMASYGRQNLAFLRAVAKKYDPDQVFQPLVLGGGGGNYIAKRACVVEKGERNILTSEQCS